MARGVHHPRHGRGGRGRRPRAGHVPRRARSRRARSHEVFARAARIAYTRALLAAVPQLGAMRGQRRCRRKFRAAARRRGRAAPPRRAPHDTVRRTRAAAAACSDLVTRFDVRSGLLRPRARAASMRSSRSASTCAPARRWRWSANRAAASRPPAARCCAWSTARRRQHRVRRAATSRDLPHRARCRPLRRDIQYDLPGPVRLARSAADRRLLDRRAAAASTASPGAARPQARVDWLLRHVGLPPSTRSAIRTSSPAASGSASRSRARSRSTRR